MFQQDWRNVCNSIGNNKVLKKPNLEIHVDRNDVLQNNKNISVFKEMWPSLLFLSGNS